MASVIQITSDRLVVKSTWTCTARIDPTTHFVVYDYTNFRAGYLSATFNLRQIGAGASILAASLTYSSAVTPSGTPGYYFQSIPDYGNVAATSQNIKSYLDTLGGNYDTISIRFQFRASPSSPGSTRFDNATAVFDNIKLTLTIEGGGDPPAPISGVITGGVEYEMRPVLYDRGFHMIGSLANASNISYRHVRNDLYTAAFELPKEDPMVEQCRTHAIVAIYDNGAFEGLYRIVDEEMVELTDPTAKIRFILEHVIAFLRDDVYDGSVSVSGTVSGIINSILSQQTTMRWRLGSCEFSAYYDYEFENESLLSALFKCTDKLTSNFHWTYDLTQYPWTINLVRQNTVPQCSIRDGENLIALRREKIGAELYTKVFCRGKDGLGIADVNPTHLPYILAPDDVRDRNGTVSGNFVDTDIDDADRLYSLGLKALTDHMEPRYAYEVEAADIRRITNNPEHAFDEGKVTKISYSPMEIEAYAMITAFEKPDVLGDPLAANIEIETMNLSDIEKPIDPSREIYLLYDETYVFDIDWAGNSFPRQPYTGAGKYSLEHASGSSGAGGYLLLYISGSTGAEVLYNTHVATVDRVRIPSDATRICITTKYVELPVNIVIALLPPNAPNSMSATSGGHVYNQTAAYSDWHEHLFMLPQEFAGSDEFKVVINAVGTSGRGIDGRRNLQIKKIWFE